LFARPLIWTFANARIEPAELSGPARRTCTIRDRSRNRVRNGSSSNSGSSSWSRASRWTAGLPP